MVKWAKKSKLFLRYQRIFKKEVLPYLKKNFPVNEYTEPVWYYTLDIPRSFFRSVVPLCLAKVFKKDKKFVLPVIAASEIIFSITLIQDDIIDGDVQRQGLPSAWKKYGLPICVASIDYCYYYAYKILEEVEKYLPRERAKLIYDIFLESQQMVNQSFLFEKLHRMDLKLTTKDMLKLLEWKTITGISAQYCSILALNTPMKDCLKMHKYALLNAYAGQIKNDIVDFFKIRGYAEYRKFSDFKRGYMNYPIVKLYKECNNKDKIIFKRNYGKARKSNINAIMKLIDKYNIAEKTMDDCKKFVEDAKKSIASFKNCPEKDTILDWADSSVRFARASKEQNK